jgi:hypothetical protein
MPITALGKAIKSQNRYPVAISLLAVRIRAQRVESSGFVVFWSESLYSKKIHMLETATVVTPTRFEQGLTYADFLAQAKINRDKFELYYKDSPLSDDDLSFFKQAAALAQGPAKILALAEAWCSDVYRELPTVARIAGGTGMSLRIFLRDENPDIMDEFLSNNGKSRAIPVFVFYTKETRYITHFTERPAIAHAELASIGDQVKSELGLPMSATYATLPEADKQVFIREMIARIRPRFPGWQKDSIKEMRGLLATALKLPHLAAN